MINRIFDVLVSIAFITIYIIGHYEFSLLIPITILINILCIAFGFYVSTVNKKHSQKIMMFIRTGFSIRTILPPILSIGAYFSFEYSIDYHLDLSQKESPFIYAAPLIIAMYFGMKHQNMINSLRVYQNGVQLPGPLSKIIHWKNIQALSRSKDMILIQINDKVKKIKILKNDLDIFDKLSEIHKKITTK